MRSILVSICAFFIVSCTSTDSSSTSKPTKPHWQPMERTTKAHIRGLMMVNDHVAWASGTDCTVLKSIDGNTWQNVSVMDTQGLDFRDVHAFDEDNAIVMSAGNGAAIYKTTDGGENWMLVYKDTNRRFFLDGMDFNSEGVGFIYGDPLKDQMTLLQSTDFGQTWKACDQSPTLDTNEAGYAASGTGIAMLNRKLYIATSGGRNSHFHSIQRADTFKTTVPIHSEPGAGIFSMTFWNEDYGVAVGGNYIDSNNSNKNCAITHDGGQSWIPIQEHQPQGYRSCVASNKDGSLIIACGRSGSDYSLDSGRSWVNFTDEGYFTCSIFGESGWAMGRNGKTAKLLFQ